MFVCSDNLKKSVDNFKTDTTLYDSIPKEFSRFKNKTFLEWEIPPWELFIFKDKLIGSGSFSNVYLAKWRETLVVAKVINKDICEEKQKLLFIREIEIMTKLHHPNIVQFLGYIDSPFIIIMEYIPEKNLLDCTPRLNLKQKISVTKDIFQGLAYFHNRIPESLIHRDIKPTNILLTTSKKAKIADFGLSRLYHLENMKRTLSSENIDNPPENNEKKEDQWTGDVGTRRYMSPELVDIIKSKNMNFTYSNKIDIYSCGIMLYELFESKRYFPGEVRLWNKCPKYIKNMIEDHMLCINPEERDDALTLLRNLNNYEEESVNTCCSFFK